MDVRLPSWRRDEEGDFTEYECVVGSTEAGASTTVWRRFSLWKQLDDALPAELKARLETPFPRTPFLRSFGLIAEDDAFRDSRRQLLEEWLRSVVEAADGDAPATLRTFLSDSPPPLPDALPEEPAAAEAAATSPLARTPSESIDVPRSRTPPADKAPLGSPLAVSPPDEHQQQCDSDEWIVLTDSDEDEGAEETPDARVPSPQAKILPAAPPSPSPTPAATASSEPEPEPQPEPAARDQRSYVAAARASMLVGQTLPAEPTKQMMVQWMQDHCPHTFLKEHRLVGQTRSIANARTRQQICDAYYLALVAKIPEDRLESLIFETMDSDLDGTLDREELRFSPFESKLGHHWDALGTSRTGEGKPCATRADWKRFVVDTKQKVGGALSSFFLASLVYDCDVDCRHLLPVGQH